MSGQLDDKTAIVTGAGCAGDGWGVGKAIAAVLCAEGARVMGVDKDASAAAATRDAIGERFGDEAAKRYRAYAADVTDATQVEAMARACADAFGRIDALVNNVGVLASGGCVEADEREWDRVHGVNVKSIFTTVKHILPTMRRQRSGVILNMSSIAAHRWTGVSFAAYSSSKGAILSLTRAIALENAKLGVRALSISPGLLDTPMVRLGFAKRLEPDQTIEDVMAARAAQCPTGKMGSAFDVAHLCAFLASDKARYMTGVDVLVDGGLSATIG